MGTVLAKRWCGRGHRSGGEVEDKYDPRNPDYILPASTVQVEEINIAMFEQQICRLQCAISHRENEDEHHVLEHYKRVLFHLHRSLQAALDRRDRSKCAKSGGQENSKKELEFKEDDQEYGQVTKMIGNGRCDVFCVDGTKRLCHIRGKLREKVWVNQGDIVLLSPRDFQDEKDDIVVRYTPEEARKLKTHSELPDTVKINETDIVYGELSDDGFIFDDQVGVDLDAI